MDRVPDDGTATTPISDEEAQRRLRERRGFVRIAEHQPRHASLEEAIAAVEALGNVRQLKPCEWCGAQAWVGDDGRVKQYCDLTVPHSEAAQRAAMQAAQEKRMVARDGELEPPRRVKVFGMDD